MFFLIKFVGIDAARVAVFEQGIQRLTDNICRLFIKYRLVWNKDVVHVAAFCTIFDWTHKGSLNLNF